MASIQKRTRGGKTTYRVQYRDPSGAMRGKVFDRMVDAKRFKTETECAKGHNAWTDPRAGKATLRSYGDAHLAAQTFDETNREAVALRLRLHVYPHVGDYQLAALRPSVIQAGARGLQQQLAPSYVRVVFANLSAILQAAVDDGAIGCNPCRAGSVKPPAPDRRKVLPWSAERVAAVAALPESVALRLAAHLEAWPAVAATLPGGSRPGGRRRPGCCSRPRDNGMHAARHYYASALLEDGVSIRAVAEYLGHNDPGFTLRVYAHLMPSSEGRARAAIDRALGGSPVVAQAIAQDA